MTIAKAIAGRGVRRAFLLAVTLLVVQTAAAMHELQHALHQDTNPSCPLHVYTDHFGKLPASTFVVALPQLRQDAPVVRLVVTYHTYPALGYYTRGPPRSS